MKAVRLDRTGEAMHVDELPQPALRSGAARVRVTRAPVLSFMRSVVSGALGYTIPAPCTPGGNAIGVVDAVADDAFGVKPGELVFVDPGLRSGPESALLGLTGTSPGAAALQALYRDGTFAEQVLVPAENLTSLDAVASAGEDQLACLSYLAIPYGGLLRGDFRPGQSVIVNGATGNLGSAAVLVALAMGARRVIAVGREREILGTLAGLSARVSTVALTGDGRDKQAIVEASDGGVELVLDMMGSAPTPEPTMACLGALQPRGTAVLMGGVTADLPIAYSDVMLREIAVRGCFMYPRDAPARLVGMVSAGLLDLSAIRTRSFPLPRFDQALEEASRARGPNYCLLVPGLV